MWTLTRFESSTAAARARKLEDEQVRAAGAALDAIKPGGETARSGLGDGTKPFPAGTLDGGFGPNANDANAPADAAARNELLSKVESRRGAMNAGGSFPFQNQNAHHDYPSSVVYVDTLAMVRALKRAGMDARVAEGVAREIASATKNATGPLASRAEFEKLTVSLTAKVDAAEREMKSRQREAESSSRHSVDVVTVEIEKLRSELRFAHEKIATSQKLDLNLERGRCRPCSGRTIRRAPWSRVIEISSMKTTIEAAKNDVIKYSIGAIMSMAAVGMSLETAHVCTVARNILSNREENRSQAADSVLSDTFRHRRPRFRPMGPDAPVADSGVGLDLCEKEQSALARRYVLTQRLETSEPWSHAGPRSARLAPCASSRVPHIRTRAWTRTACCGTSGAATGACYTKLRRGTGVAALGWRSTRRAWRRARNERRRWERRCLMCVRGICETSPRFPPARSGRTTRWTRTRRVPRLCFCSSPATVLARCPGG